MRRITLTDGSTWFDAEKADVFKAHQEFDGSSFVDINTGDQFTHQELYRTISGKYILHTWTGREGREETYVMIDDQAAYDWLLKNHHEDAVPNEEDEERNLDKSGPTPLRHVRIPDDLWDKAIATGNASKLINDLLTEYFAKR